MDLSQKIIKILGLAIYKTKDICSLPNPPFKPRPLIGSIRELQKNLKGVNFSLLISPSSC